MTDSKSVTLQNEVTQYLLSTNTLKKDFAARIGITPVMLSHWLNGRCSLRRETLERIVSLIFSGSE